MVASIYEKILGKELYKKAHDIIYGNFSSILYNIYEKSPRFISLLPAPRLHIFHPDRLETRDRRLLTVIQNNPELSDEEKIMEYGRLKNEVMMRMYSKTKYSYDTKWVFNQIAIICDKKIKELEKIIQSN